MTPIDDLKRGDWIAIVGRADKPETAKWSESDGFPLQIEEMSLPFLAVWVRDVIKTVDIRWFNVRKVTSRYARIVLAHGVANTRPSCNCNCNPQASPNAHR